MSAYTILDNQSIFHFGKKYLYYVFFYHGPEYFVRTKLNNKDKTNKISSTLNHRNTSLIVTCVSVP
jgi:hypothetical protein